MTKNSASEQDSELKLITQFIAVEHQARECDSIKSLARFIANETQGVVPYEFIAVWSRFPHPEILSITHAPSIDTTQPTYQWLIKLLKKSILTNNHTKNTVILPEELNKELREKCPFDSFERIIYFPFFDGKSNTLLGGALVFLAGPLSKKQEQLLNLINSQYCFIWKNLTKKPPLLWRIKKIFKQKKYQLLGLIVIIALVNLPVRQTVTGNASVVPINAVPINAPMDGIIQKILIKNNVLVNTGTPLIEMKEIEVSNQLELAKKSYDIAMEKYRQTQQLSFNDIKERSRLPQMQAELSEARTKLLYAERVNKELMIKAPIGGIPLIEDRNEWQGKPVTTGEKIMEIAPPDEAQFKITLPTSEQMFNLSGSNVKVFLNYDPLHSFDAKISHIDYQAEYNSESQQLVYVMYASLDQNKSKLPLLGSVGTAKLYGPRVVFWYDLLKKPIANMRQWFGL